MKQAADVSASAISARVWRDVSANRWFNECDEVGPIVDTMGCAAAIWTLPDRATRSALVVTRRSDRISGASR
jgi:hypothetical protein